VTAFGVETVVLDLPAVTAAFGRRLRDAGVPVTPERPAAFARALDLVRPLTLRRLYWTGRGVFVSDQAHVAAFDSVFRSVFGVGSDLAIEHEAAATRDVVPLEQTSFSDARGDEDPSEEFEIPRAVAGDEERFAGRHFG
jgi:uncharacterized protein with von Willebrand factor type A (vWA) domain